MGTRESVRTAADVRRRDAVQPRPGEARFILGNGLTAILVEDHWHPTAALEVCYRVGGRDDPYGKEGLSHLLEHLTFHSPSAARSPEGEAGEFAARAHATTNQDTTCYGYGLPRDELGNALAVEARRMSTLDITSADLEREKNVVARERGEVVEGDTWRALLEEIDSAAFRLHPYRFPVAGWPETLQQIGIEDVRAHFSRFYAPANAVLVVVGDIESERVQSLVERVFGSIPRRELARAATPVEPAARGERRIILAPRDLPRVAFAYHVPPLSSEEGAVLEVIRSLLAGAEDAPLAAVLHQEDAADDVRVEYDPLSRDPNLFYVKVVPNARRPDFGRIVAIVDDVTGHLASEGPDRSSLERAKKRVLLRFHLEHSPAARARRIATAEAVGGPRRADDYARSVGGVDTADVQEALRKYFSPGNRVLGTTGSDRLAPHGPGRRGRGS